MDNGPWLVYRNGAQDAEPLTADAVRALPEFPDALWVWREGMAEWTSPRALTDFFPPATETIEPPRAPATAAKKDNRWQALRKQLGGSASGGRGRRIALWAGGGVLGLWLAIFALNSALGTKVGFDYDDTVAFSSPSFRAGDKKYGEGFRGSDKEREAKWKEINSDPSRDIPKPLTMAIVRAAKLLGCDVVIITARKPNGREPFEEYWGDVFDEIHFEKEKARILGEGRYLAFFGDSDGDIEEAEKAGVIGIRIMRHPSSDNKREYEPGSFGEWIVPWSEGPDQ